MAAFNLAQCAWVAPAGWAARKQPSFSRSATRRLQTVMHTSTATAEAQQAINKADCPGIKPQLLAGALEALDIRVGAVLAAEAVSVEVEQRRGDQVRKRDHKLLKLLVDIGVEQRTIVADIYALLDEESAVGKKLLVVANTAPAELHGHSTHGMLLIGTNYDTTPMPRSFKNILPTPGRLPPGSTYSFE